MYVTLHKCDLWKHLTFYGQEKMKMFILRKWKNCRIDLEKKAQPVPIIIDTVYPIKQKQFLEC